MQSMLTINDVPDEIFAPTCVILDKLDKIGAEAVVKELTETLGLPRETAENVVKALSCKTVEELEEMAREAIERAVVMMVIILIAIRKPWTIHPYAS